MDSVLQNIFTLIIITEFIFGNMSNGFIILINSIDWVRKRKLSLIDQILVFLAVSRIILIRDILASWITTLNHSFSFMTATELRSLTLSWVLSNHFSLWLATILSILYLLKIAYFSRPVFLYLKWRMKKVLLMVLLGTLVFLLFNLTQIIKLMDNWIYQNEMNLTYNSTVSDHARFMDLVIFNMTLFSLIPFAVATISSLLLIFSLWKHLQKMKLNSQGHRDPSTKAHVNALRIMISFLLLYSTYFLSLFLSWLFKMYNNKLVHMLYLTAGLIYPASHSFILILGNSKLRQACLLVLRQLKCGLKHKRLIIP